MSYRPNIAAALNDPRFRGIERVDLRARYGAPLDGTLHPLSTMGLTAAQALYPNIGLTSGTNLTTFSQDTAAFLQAEYDLRTGNGGIIGLPDAAAGVLSAQWWLQDASKVWLHGGRHNRLLSSRVASGVAAVRVTGAQGLNALPLRDLYLFSTDSGVSVPQNASDRGTTAGTPHTSFVTGSSAIQIDQSQGATFERIVWNGYDESTLWGDNTFGILFKEWVGQACNKALSWKQSTGLNSMEKMRFENGAGANCNYGVYWDATYGSNSQGGSVFLTGNSFDYNIVRAVLYKGLVAGNTSCGNSFHVTGNHIETTGACSGTAVCRMFSQGASFTSHNELYEGDGGIPPGFIEVADGTMASGNNNRINSNAVPLFYSTTGNTKRVSGIGNVCQDVGVRPVLLKDSNGTRLQPSIEDGTMVEVYNDVDQSTWATLYGKVLSLYYFGGAGNFTLPNDSTFNFPIHHCIEVVLEGADAATQSAHSGETRTAQYDDHRADRVDVRGYPGTLLSSGGFTRGKLHKVGSNAWRCMLGP